MLGYGIKELVTPGKPLRKGLPGFTAQYIGLSWGQKLLYTAPLSDKATRERFCPEFFYFLKNSGR